MRKLWILWVILWGVSSGLYAQTKITKQALLEAMRRGSVYTTQVLLDEQGKAKGDYDLLQATWTDYEAMWHTGQLIGGLLAVYEVTKEPTLLEKARQAGDWWIAQQMQSPAKMKGMLRAVHGASVGDYINVTTITDGTPPIFQLANVTKDKRYARVCQEAGDWLLTHTYIEEEGLFYNIIDPTTGEVWKDKSPHAQHQKEEVTLKMVARPNVEGYLFKDLYAFTGKKRYKEVFLNQCETLLKTQHENGFWMDFEPNNPETGYVHPRFNIWNAEALVETYTLTKEKKYLEAATKTAKGMQKLMQKNGVIYYKSYTNGKHKTNSATASATAFSGLLWLRLKKLGDNTFDEDITKAAQWLLANQFPSNHPDKNLAGGFIDLRLRQKKGKSSIVFRDIATAFALRFLAAYYQEMPITND
ncbi:MAG: glycoside hydrolase family 47 protein [Thermonemataceae bacterium]